MPYNLPYIIFVGYNFFGMPTTSTIRFELFKTRTNKTGITPIRLVYSVSRVRQYIPTGIKVWAGNWNQNKQQITYLTKAQAKAIQHKLNYPMIDFDLLPLKKDVELMNANLAGIKQKIRAIESNFELNNSSWKTADVIEVLKQKDTDAPQAMKTEPKVYVADFIHEYAERNRGIIKPRTLATYVTLEKHLHVFAKRKQDRITFQNLTHDKLSMLHKYFIGMGMNNTTISKQFSILKALMKAAIKEGKGRLNVCQDFRDYTVTRKDSDYEVIALDQPEFDAILDIDLCDYNNRVQYTKKIKGKDAVATVSFKTLDKVRDLFVFACTTGLRFSDLSDLKREHLRDNWIHKKAVKTGQQLAIPLNAISYFVLEKNSELPTPLPTMSNQKANEYLKILGQIAGIDSLIEKTREYGTKSVSTTYKKYELMSMHMGRRVFASLSLAKGVPSQNVMSLTGHKKFASFKRYMHIDKTQKLQAMSVWGKIEKGESATLKTAK